MRNLFLHRTKASKETRKRIVLTVAAYAYEFDSNSIISDADYDELSRQVDLSIDTARPDLDAFWRKEFHPDTGQWIHDHPELDKVKQTYERWMKYGI